MSLAIIYSRAQSGIKAPMVTVETHISNGLPSFSIVGLPETAVKESKDRVRSALINSHFDFPSGRITVNLAPADLPKEGGRFDLPIALSILAATRQIPKELLVEYEFAGELALSGELRAIHGALPLALAAHKAQRQLIIPQANAEEAALVKQLTVLPAQHLLDVCAHLQGQQKLTEYLANFPSRQAYEHDFSEVRGQPHARRALTIAAAGGHSVLMLGPPGTGKTMLASRLPSILPNMTEAEALEVAALASISAGGFKSSHWLQRPFRAPHHTASTAAMVGGGNPPRPGEISLAHGGVLFLDELPEFNRRVLEALREPLGSGVINISRAACQAEFPAKFQLVAAMNPCPCGYAGDPNGRCRCTSEQIQRYRAKISGPLLDRIDMHIEVPRLTADELTRSSDPIAESSEQMRAKVEQARQRMLARAGKCNAELKAKELEKFSALSDQARQLLERAIDQLKLSARAYHRIWRVAQTIADFAAVEYITSEHVAEAIHYRRLELI
jgi:magnesium chelatase family protein